MRQEDSDSSGPLSPFVAMRRNFPFEADATSERLRWTGLEASRFRKTPATDLYMPALTHHKFSFFARPPEELDLRYEGVKRHVPPPAGSIALVPAGHSAEWRWKGDWDSFHIYLEPGFVRRVAAESFDLDPSRLTVPPLDALNRPRFRAVMVEVDAELSTGGAGGPLAAESLANILAVHLIRHALAPRRPSPWKDGRLPHTRLRAVCEYIEEHLDGSPSLEQLAAVVHLSSSHFARQFKAATGLPPHQYVIMRRVERAKQLLQGGSAFSLAQVASHAGFVDQSQLCRHFKRLVGVTPGQFRTPAKSP